MTITMKVVVTKLFCLIVNKTNSTVLFIIVIELKKNFKGVERTMRNKLLKY